MAEMFFPPSGGKAFMPSNTLTNLDAAMKKDRQSAGVSKEGQEERLFLELRDMRRQIQTACAEEIRSQTQRMLQELRREVQTLAEHFKPLTPEIPVGGILTHRGRLSSSAGKRTSTASRKSLQAFRKSAKSVQPVGLLQPEEGFEGQVSGPKSCLKKSHTSPGSTLMQPSTLEAPGNQTWPEMPTSPSDPRCPLSAYGDVPPLMPLEVEPPPVLPAAEASKPGFASLRGSARAAADGRGVCFDQVDSFSEKSSQLSGYDACEGRRDFASHRRLSLAVDACRRTAAASESVPVCKMSARDFLNSTRFDNLIGGLIILNAITIGLQTDYAATNLTDDFPASFQTVERIFLVCFAMELMLRIYVQKVRFFCERKSLAWNYFDTVIVTAQVTEEVLTLVTTSTSDTKADQFQILRILRLLRIVRILRVVRVLHLISELRTIVSSIMGSFKSLAWTVVLLLLMIYIVSVYFTQTISDYLIEKQTGGVAFDADDAHLLYFFGSLSRTILSLWQAMSGGADWDSMAGPLIEQVGAVTGILFAAYIAFALLALMNVVTGVFVQTALQSAKDEEDAFLVDQVLKLFDMAGDVKDKATISMGQIEDRLADPLVAAEWRSINVQPAEAQYLFSLLDIEETGEISFQEFLSGCLRLHGPAKSMDVLTVMQEARSAMRLWRMSQKRLDEYQFLYQNTMETIANSVATCSNLVARLSLNIDSAVEVANQNQDKIGRLEKRIRSFEGSLCSVRIAASNMNKVIAAELPPEMNDLIDTVISPSANGRPVAPDDNASTTVGSPAGSLPRIDEV